MNENQLLSVTYHRHFLPPRAARRKRLLGSPRGKHAIRRRLMAPRDPRLCGAPTEQPGSAPGLYPRES